MQTLAGLCTQINNTVISEDVLFVDLLKINQLHGPESFDNLIDTHLVEKSPSYLKPKCKIINLYSHSFLL